jgi:hypothetical protein
MTWILRGHFVDTCVVTYTPLPPIECYHTTSRADGTRRLRRRRVRFPCAIRFRFAKFFAIRRHKISIFFLRLLLAVGSGPVINNHRTLLH